jgi:hypothetical protein
MQVLAAHPVSRGSLALPVSRAPGQFASVASRRPRTARLTPYAAVRRVFARTPVLARASQQPVSAVLFVWCDWPIVRRSPGAVSDAGSTRTPRSAEQVSAAMCAGLFGRSLTACFSCSVLLGAAATAALVPAAAKAADDSTTVASSRMSYSRFLEYLDMGRVKKVRCPVVDHSPCLGYELLSSALVAGRPVRERHDRNCRGRLAGARQQSAARACPAAWHQHRAAGQVQGEEDRLCSALQHRG